MKRSSAVAKRPVPQPPDVIGDRAVAVRDELFEMVGYDRSAQAVDLARSLQVMRDEMSAHRVERVVVRAGRDREEVREFTDVDHNRRHAGADGVQRILGVHPSKNAGGSGPTAIQVNITFRDMDDGVVEADVVQVPAE